MVTQAGYTSSSEESLMYNALVKQTTQTDSLDQFDLRNEGRVRQYLQQYPFLPPLLIEAQAHIKRLFSPDAGTALEVTDDPSDGSLQLYLIISTGLKAAAAYDLFERLDQEWWLEACERAQFRLNIIPEFI